MSSSRREWEKAWSSCCLSISARPVFFFTTDMYHRAFWLLRSICSTLRRALPARI